MDNRPHYIWAFVVIAIVGIVAWIYSSNRANTENYAKGSDHQEQTFHNYGLLNLQPGCQNNKAEDFMRGKRNAQSLATNNSTASR